MMKTFCVVAATLILISCHPQLRQPVTEGQKRTPAQSDCQTLDGKIQAQIARNLQARRVLVERVGRGGQRIERGEWQAMLEPGESCRMTAQELQELRRRQLATIRQAREKAIAESRLDLNPLRADADKLQRFCAAVPKGGMLHIHANGTITRATAARLLEKNNSLIPADYWLKKTADKNVELSDSEKTFLKTLAQQGNQPYKSYPAATQTRLLDFFFMPTADGPVSFKRFSYAFFIFPVLDRDASGKPTDATTEVYRDFLNDNQKRHVSYVEYTKGGREVSSEAMAAIVARIQGLQAETGVTVRYNFEFFRNAAPADNDKLATALIAYLSEHPSSFIPGINLAANEELDAALEAGQGIYARVLAAEADGKLRLHKTFHAGELGRPENVRDAMIMGAERVGHGVKLQEDPVTLEWARERRLGIETNLISNQRLGVTPDLKQHPFLNYLRLGLPVSLATDDEGVLQTDINRECVAAIQNSDLTYAEWRQLARNSLTSSFADDGTKAKLLQQLDVDLDRFEAEWLKN